MANYKRLCGLAVLAVTSAVCVIPAAEAQSRDYIKSKMYSRDPALDVEQGGDLPEDFLPGNNDPDSIPGKRARVEAYVKSQLDRAKLGDDEVDGDVAIASSPEDFNNIVALANGGNTTAMYEVGKAIETGSGTGKDDAAALEWYKRAAERNFPAAFSAIGDIYRERNGQSESFLGELKGRISTSGNVAKSDVTAREWYEKGMKLRDPRSFEGMSELYRGGLAGLEQNNREANWHHQKSVMMTEYKAKEALRKKTKLWRQEAEAREGLIVETPHAHGPGDTHTPVNTEKTTNEAVAETPIAVVTTSQTLQVPGGECSYLSASEQTVGYRATYLANCPTAVQLENLTAPLSIAGMDCKAEIFVGSNGTHRFLCNPKAESYKLGNTDCTVQSLGKTNDADETFRLFCNGAQGKFSGRTQNYLGMKCRVQPYTPSSREDPSYDLFCKRAVPTKEKPVNPYTHAH